MESVLKSCTTCGESKPLDEFHVHSKRKDGRTARCKDCAKRIARDWYTANRDRHRKASKAYDQANRESLRVAKRKYEQANRERIRAGHKAWKIANAESVRLSALFSRMNARAKQFGVPFFVISKRDRARLLSTRACAVHGCTSGDIQVDHLIPLSRGGSHSIGNVHLLCRRHNRMKSDQTWMEFRQMLRASEAVTS